MRDELRNLIVSCLVLVACQGEPGQVAAPLTLVAGDLWITPTGSVERVADLSEIEAFGFTDDGVRVALPVRAVGAAAEVRRLTPGPVYLHHDDDWFASSGELVDLGRAQLGRPDVAAGQIDLDLAIGALSPWSADHQLQLYSAGAGAWLLGGLAGVDDGATELEAAVTYSGPLVQADRGDRLWVAQLVTGELDGNPYSALARAAEVSAADFTEPRPGVLTGLSPAPRSAMVIDWRTSEFDRLHLVDRPLVAGAWYDANLAALVGADAHGFYGLAADLVTMRVAAGSGRDLAGRFDFGNPFPDDWTVMATFIAWYPYVVRAHPDDAPLVLFDNLWIRDRADQLDRRPIEPVIGPPRRLRVDGTAAAEGMFGVGRTPRLSWDPPALGDAAGYRLRVISLRSVDGVTIEVGRTELTTTATAIRIPPGAVAPIADAFALQLQAVAGDLDLAHRPRSLSLPQAVASLTTPALAP